LTTPDEPPPTTPRVVRAARQLGYVSAGLWLFDVAWAALAHDNVRGDPYTIGAMLITAAAVLSGIFSFLTQTDHRRARREERRHAELARALGLLRQWVEGSGKRVEGWLADMSSHDMVSAEAVRAEIAAAFGSVAVKSTIQSAVTREVDAFLLDLAEDRPDVVDLETVKILRQAQRRR